MEIEDAVKKAKQDAAERNFTQSVDLIINLTNVDLSDPENRFAEEVSLPYRASDDTTVCIIGDTLEAENADRSLSSDELEELFEDETKAKQLAEEVDHFIAEAPLMPDIGRQLGPVLGPRNKMPKPTPPGSDVSERIEDLRQTVSVRVREQPSVKCKIGNEAMPDDELAGNAQAVIDFVEQNMPRGHHNLKDVYLKLTMGPVVEAR